MDKHFVAWQESFTDDEWEDVDPERAFVAGMADGEAAGLEKAARWLVNAPVSLENQFDAAKYIGTLAGTAERERMHCHECGAAYPVGDGRPEHAPTCYRGSLPPFAGTLATQPQPDVAKAPPRVTTEDFATLAKLSAAVAESVREGEQLRADLDLPEPGYEWTHAPEPTRPAKSTRAPLSQPDVAKALAELMSAAAELVRMGPPGWVRTKRAMELLERDQVVGQAVRIRKAHDAIRATLNGGGQ